MSTRWKELSVNIEAIVIGAVVLALGVVYLFSRP
jgi:hypothetical protein